MFRAAATNDLDSIMRLYRACGFTADVKTGYVARRLLPFETERITSRTVGPQNLREASTATEG